jgi:hypothetical protein
MPNRAQRPCEKCGILTASRFCGAHAGEPRKMAQAYDSARAKDPVRRLYGTRRWRYTSRATIVRHPLCKGCGREPSVLADHVIPAEQYVAQHGGDLDSFFDEVNLQALGLDCHGKKSGEDRKRRGYGGHSLEALERATAVKLFTRVSVSQKLAPNCNATA